MYNLNTLHEYTCLIRFYVVNETQRIVLIFADPIMAKAFGRRVEYDSLVNQELVMRLDEFSLSELWPVERTVRYIAKHTNKAMAKLEK